MCTVKLFIGLGILFLSYIGCSQKPVFVVYRDIPTNPSFVVIPASNFSKEIQFANNLESSIIKAGVKVVSSPVTKEVVTKKEFAQIQAQPLAGAEASMTERYFVYEDTDANYVLFSYFSTKRIKIIKKDSKEILITFELKKPDKQPSLKPGETVEDFIVYEALKAVGIPVKPRNK